MSRRRSHGDGSIKARSKDTFLLRYRVNGTRYAKTVHGTLAEARKELRRLLQTGDDNQHVPPSRLTLRQWSEQWLRLLGRGLVGAKTRERYFELLKLYVLPTLGERRLQQLTVLEIDNLYSELEKREKRTPVSAAREKREKHLSVTTVRHVHVCLRACLRSAVRKKLLSANPTDGADIPPAQDPDIGQALEPDELKRLLDGFRGSTLYPLVATAALTGARLSELLGLRWSDLNPETRILRIERAVEDTRELGRRLKEPKSWRGKRTIEIDPSLLKLLLSVRETYLRQVAGVPDGTAVDLSLVRLPETALMFPSPIEPFSFTRLRNPKTVTKNVRAHFRRLGFATLRFHDLRVTHETGLLDRGVPIHVVAKRGGHDPAVLLRSYAKRTRKADSDAATVIATLSRGLL